MRLLTFVGPAGSEAGALAPDGSIVPLSRSGDARLGSVQALIEGGTAALDTARAILASSAERIAADSVEWLAPLPRPVQIRDFLVFEEHMRIAGWRGAQLRASWGGPPAPAEPMAIPQIWYEQPIYYKCNRFAVSAGGTVDWPAHSRAIDYELELACVIGKGGRDIAAANAADHIFGFTIFNDLTARDLQFREMQAPLGPAKGKDFDGANVLGPVIVTRDELGDEPDLVMRAFVNGETWSEGRSGTMHHTWAAMIEYVSRGETLHPGEVLGSGTVGGGCGLELGRLLMDGDEVRLDIEGIGSVTSRIHAPHVKERPSL